MPETNDYRGLGMVSPLSAACVAGAMWFVRDAPMPTFQTKYANLVRNCIKDLPNAEMRSEMKEKVPEDMELMKELMGNTFKANYETEFLTLNSICWISLKKMWKSLEV